jgi:hypothetical protein
MQVRSINFKAESDRTTQQNNKTTNKDIMRIISKFHDYYDRAMAAGQDMTVTYSRVVAQIPFPEPVKNLIKAEHDSRQQHTAKGNFDIEFFMIAFCGKIYRGIKVRHEIRIVGQQLPTMTDSFFYEFERFQEYTTKFEINFSDRRNWWLKTSFMEIVRNYLSEQGTTEVEKYLISKNIIILSVARKEDNERNPYYSRFTTPACIENDHLGKFEFYKMIDAFTTYQEIDMYISGTLPQQNAMPINISDKDRAVQHGFDKWSFRKMPEQSAKK